MVLQTAFDAGDVLVVTGPLDFRPDDVEGFPDMPNTRQLTVLHLSHVHLKTGQTGLEIQENGEVLAEYSPNINHI